jgi:hypothetical protein
MLGTMYELSPDISGEAQRSSLPPAQESAITTVPTRGNPANRRRASAIAVAAVNPPGRSPGSPRAIKAHPNHTLRQCLSAQRRRSTQTRRRNSRTSGSAGPQRKRNPPCARWTKTVFAVAGRLATQQRRSACNAEVTASVPLLSHPGATEWESRPSRALARDELEERSDDLRGRLLRQEKQGHRQSIGRYRVLMQAATIRRGRRRRWLLRSDNLGRAAPSGSTAPLV